MDGENQCIFCGEEILPTDSVPKLLRNGEKIHAECEIRIVFGSVGHQRRLCSCFGGQGDGDPEGKSLRECARLAREEFVMQSKAIHRVN